MYDIFVSAIIGLIQGITEFLPISSTAHNRLVSGLLLGGKDIGLVASNIIQFGTLLAIVKYFWSDLQQYFDRLLRIITSKTALKFFLSNVKAWLTNSDSVDKNNVKYQSDVTLAQLLLATIPIAIFGILFRNIADDLRTNFGIGLFLIIGAGLMGFAEWFTFNHKSNDKSKVISLKQTFLIGVFQALAIFPGMSRSGSTISGAFLSGLDRAKAVRFAFLLSVPAVGLAGVKDIIDVIKNFKSLQILPNDIILNSTGRLSLVGIIIGTMVSYFAGIICLKWLIKYLSTNTFKWFIVYRIILGLLLISIFR